MSIFPDINKVSVSDIEALKARGVKEGPVLDYKKELPSPDHDNRYELLKDVSAMANSQGGIIIYGIEEQDGAPVNLPGLDILSTDELSNQIDNILNDGLEERIYGVRHKAILRDDDRYYYVISIPSSYLSPHMITIKTTKPRFYQRINTVNVPMNVRQIKEAVLKMQTAEDKAVQYIVGRQMKTSSIVNTKGKHSYYLLNIVPLYSDNKAVDLTDYNITQLLFSLGSNTPKISIDGYCIFYDSGSNYHHTLITRNGAVEFCYYPMPTQKYKISDASIDAILLYRLENKVIDNIELIVKKSIQGVAELPAIISLILVNMYNTNLLPTPNGELTNKLEEHVINCDPVIVHDWSQLNLTIKGFFDFVCQAYGMRKSPNFNQFGDHVKL